jgi:hypothetical protein
MTTKFHSHSSKLYSNWFKGHLSSAWTRLQRDLSDNFSPCNSTVVHQSSMFTLEFERETRYKGPSPPDVQGAGQPMSVVWLTCSGIHACDLSELPPAWEQETVLRFRNLTVFSFIFFFLHKWGSYCIPVLCQNFNFSIFNKFWVWKFLLTYRSVRCQRHSWGNPFNLCMVSCVRNQETTVTK